MYWLLQCNFYVLCRLWIELKFRLIELKTNQLTLVSFFLDFCFKKDNIITYLYSPDIIHEEKNKEKSIYWFWIHRSW